MREEHASFGIPKKKQRSKWWKKAIIKDLQATRWGHFKNNQNTKYTDKNICRKKMSHKY